MQKRIFVIAAVFILLISATGCEKEASVQSEEKSNEIAPVELTQDQKEIIDLIGVQQEIMLFDYSTDKTFKNSDVWVEVYKDGELVEPKAAAISLREDTAVTWDGRLAVLISQNPDFQWTLVASQGNSRISNKSDLSSNYGTDGRAFGPVNAPSGIEEGREIVLYTSLFTDSCSIASYDGQEYVNRPELLKEYTYVHLIKCRFSN
jgi:hypothetical protein